MTLRSTLFAPIALVLAAGASAIAHPDDPKLLDRQPPYVGQGYLRDAAGPRGGPPDFPASGVELLSWLTLTDIGNFAGIPLTSGNDCWGYTSPGGREYAIMGVSHGTVFVEMTNPGAAEIIGFVPGPNSIWRDIKVYQDRAYAVSEGGNGIQTIDMSNIDGVSNRISHVGNVVLPGTAATHNVAIDADSGFLYRCGGGSNGLRIYDLADPDNPVFVGQWLDRYVHDCQVLTYTEGPFAGRQIAFCCTGFNGGGTDTGLDILDVTDKGNIVNLYPPRVFWPDPGYSHQLWLTPDRRFAYLNDELDEDGSIPTRTMVVDVTFLLGEGPTAPFVAAIFSGPVNAVGHNLYTVDNFIYEANYRSGLRVFCATDPLAAGEIGFFDTYPDDDGAQFNGAWSVFPYFASGVVIVSDIERGLFVLDPAGALASPPTWFANQPLPDIVDPAGGDTVLLAADPGLCSGSQIVPGSGLLHYDTGSGFQTTPLTDVAPGAFEILFPELGCEGVVSYYVSGLSDQGQTVTLPVTAPADTLLAIAATSSAVAFSDNFQSNLGWTTQVLGATSGQWQRGVPVNDPNWAYDPIADGDGSGACFLTQNNLGNSDVDGGAVLLLSPPLDMTGNNTTLRYLYFLTLTDGSGSDQLLVEIDGNNGAGPWTTLAEHRASTGLAWQSQQFFGEQIAALGVTFTSTMRLRFTANDGDPQSIVEAGVDGVQVIGFDCIAPVQCIKGDVSDDQKIDALDIAGFLGVLTNGAPLNTLPYCAADMDDDGIIEFAEDLPIFVDCLLTGNCP
jgi:choice-of-anchor B domain-containing protein